MLVEVRNGDIAAAIRRLKKKMNPKGENGLVLARCIEIRNGYEKPSDKKRRKRAESKRRYQKERAREVMDRGY